MAIIKVKRKKHDKIALLAKTKLNSIKFLISKALFDSYISRSEFILVLKVCVNNVLKVYDDMKDEIKNLQT